VVRRVFLVFVGVVDVFVFGVGSESVGLGMQCLLVCSVCLLYVPG